MEISTFEESLLDNDLLNFANRLEQFIEVEHNFVQGSLVLGLSSRFGSGKTTFLKMWMHELESAEPENAEPENAEPENVRPLPVYLNAWESDYFGDPLFAIISRLVESIERTGQSAKTLVDAAKDVGWLATAFGSQIAKKFTGVDPVAAGEFAEKKKTKRHDLLNLPPDSFSMFEGRKKTMEALQKRIKEFVANVNRPVLFLVDELDRCRPDYAISYLETIKHIFDVPGAVFILAADRQQLENSARTAFGPNLDFEEYYRKFVHREATLPQISKVGYQRLAYAYVNHYLQQGEFRNCFLKIDSERIDDVVELVGGLKLTPRQIQEMFRILGHVFQTSKEKIGKLRWCLGVGTIAMAAFKVGSSKYYHLLGTRQLAPDEAIAFLTGLVGDLKVRWWFMIFLTGGGLNESAADALKVLKDANQNEESGETVFNNYVQGFISSWGFDRSNGFSEIYEKLQHISQWR